MAPIARRWPKVVLIVLLSLLGLIVLVVVGLNCYVRITYAKFYERATPVFPEPGLGSGFVPQDLDYLEEQDSWLVCGYMGDGSASPIYRRSSDGALARIYVDLTDGSVYDGHGAGITSNDRYAYLTTDEGYTVIPLQSIVSAQDGDHVKAIGDVAVETLPAFINIEDDVLYIGDFYYPGTYDTPTREHIETPDGGINHAVIFAYPADSSQPYGFAQQAERVYSITGRVQGVCTNNEGAIILSTSAGIETSDILVYDPAKVVQTGTYEVDGRDAPLYCLYDRNLSQDIQAPPMAEGIEWLDGKVYMADEAACNKYFYGKLYGAGNVYAFSPASFNDAA